MTPDYPGIEDCIERLEEIAQTLEDGKIALARATDLRKQVDDHLGALRGGLDVGDGEIIEPDADADPPANRSEPPRASAGVERSGNGWTVSDEADHTYTIPRDSWTPGPQ